MIFNLKVLAEFSSLNKYVNWQKRKLQSVTHRGTPDIFQNQLYRSKPVASSNQTRNNKMRIK